MCRYAGRRMTRIKTPVPSFWLLRPRRMGLPHLRDLQRYDVRWTEGQVVEGICLSSSYRWQSGKQCNVGRCVHLFILVGYDIYVNCCGDCVFDVLHQKPKKLGFDRTMYIFAPLPIGRMIGYNTLEFLPKNRARDGPRWRSLQTWPPA